MKSSVSLFGHTLVLDLKLNIHFPALSHKILIKGKYFKNTNKIFPMIVLILIAF